LFAGCRKSAGSGAVLLPADEEFSPGGAGRPVLMGIQSLPDTVSWGCLGHPHFGIFGPGQCRLSMDGSPKKPAIHLGTFGA